MSEQGCMYREHTNGPMCNKLCDPGQRLCPHHLLLTAAQPTKTTKTTATPRGYQE